MTSLLHALIGCPGQTRADHSHDPLTTKAAHIVPLARRRMWPWDDWAAVGAERVDPATKHPDLVDDVVSPVRASALFDEPTVTRHRFDVSFTAEEYATNLSTQSGVKELAPDAQAELLKRIRRRIETHGGMLTVHHLAVLTVAKRAV